MKRVCPRWWGGLTVLILFAIRPAMAQDVLPPAVGDKGEKAERLHAFQASEPIHTEEGEGHHSEGEDWTKGHFFVYGDWLLLMPRQRAKDFAIVSPTAVVGPGGVTAVSGSIESAFLNSTSGFRIGTGYRMGEEGMELRADYTYFYSQNSRSVTAPTGGVVFATMVHPGFGNDQVGTAIGENSLKYNILDVEFGRTFKPSECLSVWFSGGGRFAWINQRMNAFYVGGPMAAAGGENVYSPVDFSGGGIRFGAEGNYWFGKSFSIYARGYGSLIMGDLHTALNDTIGGAGITGVTDHYRMVVPVAELGVGVAWKSESFRARVGYEITNWFGLVDSPDFPNDTNTGKLTHRTSDLGLDGLALELEFDF